MLSTASEITFSQEQIDQLSSLHFINQIDDHLRVVSNVNVVAVAEHRPRRVMLALDIFYDNHNVDTLGFNLHNYAFAEIIQIAKDIRSNEFILQAIDNLLAGDIE